MAKATPICRQEWTLSPQKVEEIDNSLAKFFFACNISLNVTESPIFREFVNQLNPAYKVPSRKKLSTKLLEKVYTEVSEKLKSEEETDGVLLVDGWKNSSANTKNVVCTIYTQDHRSLFLHLWDFSELRETGDELALVIDEAIVMAKEKYNINIYAVVSDNASNMMRMGRLVDVWHATCNSHSANLLLKSLVSSKFSEAMNKLLREFKTSRAERELKKRKGTRIMLACETRWCTYQDTFRCALKNLDIMRQLVHEGIVVPKEANRALLNDSSLASQLQDALVLFDPVCQLVNTCQAADRTLADATELWLTLNIPVVDNRIDETLNKRLDKVLQPVGLVANFFHPVYRGQQFTHLGLFNSKVETFLKEELAQDSLEWQGLEEYVGN